MDFFSLYSFVTLSEVLNYTKASEILHVSQPTLSKKILKLENEIGFPLFVRDKRSVALTKEGKIFLEETISLLNGFQQSIKTIKSHTVFPHDILRITLLNTSMFWCFPLLYETFMKKYPDADVFVSDNTYENNYSLLFGSNCDLVLMPKIGISELPKNIAEKEIYVDTLCLAVRKENPLASRKSVSVAELRDCRLLGVNIASSQYDNALLRSIFLREGYVPHIVLDATTIMSKLLLTKCGIGGALLASHMKNFDTLDELEFVPLEEYENKFRVVALYSKENTNRNVGRFLDMIDELRALNPQPAALTNRKLFS